MIQDYVLTAGSIVFFIAVLPMLFSKNRPPLLTSIPTGVILLIFSATYATLDLPFSCATAGLTAAVWCLTAILTVLDKRSTTCYASAVHICYRKDFDFSNQPKELIN